MIRINWNEGSTRRGAVVLVSVVLSFVLIPDMREQIVAQVLGAVAGGHGLLGMLLADGGRP